MKAYNVLKFVVIMSLPLIILAQGENWIYRYNGTGNGYDCANALVYGADSNIYATGYSYGVYGFFNAIVISLTTTGHTNWVRRPNGPDYFWSQAYSLVYGADGNIYVAGSGTDSSTSGGFTVISLTTAGNTSWVYRYGGPIYWAYSIIYGIDGNIYAAGSSIGSDTSDDFTVISLPSDYGVEEEKRKDQDLEVRLKVVPNPFTSFARIPGYEKEDFVLSDITGRLVGKFKGSRIGENLTAGVYFVVSQNKNLKPLRIVKVR
jgi:hypothetical protein